VDEATADRLRRHWEDGWNGRDVALIMAPFAEDVVFNSPFVSRLTGDPSKTTIDGYDALYEYVAGALERAGAVRYTADAVYRSTDTMVLVYRCHMPDGTDKPGADTMRVRPDGKVVEWRSHYSSEPAEISASVHGGKTEWPTPRQ
jgi:ketosteroid isomerase-like protein